VDSGFDCRRHSDHTALAEPAKGDDAVLKNMILGASADSWNAYGGQIAVYKDDGVQSGLATRITARKGQNTWDAAASITIPKPVARRCDLRRLLGAP